MSPPVATTIARLWAEGRDTMQIAEVVRWHWPRLHVNQIEPIVCRLLNQAREASRREKCA